MSKPKKYIIYALSDPRTTEIRYIGKSSSGLKRARAHLQPSRIKKTRTKCGNWIKSLIKLNLKPTIEEVEIHQNHDDLIQAEIFYVSYFRSLGFNLTNHTTGGEGTPGHKQSFEQVEKRRIAKIGSKHTEETKKKMALAHIGRIYCPCSEETKKKISIAQIGKSVPQDVRNKISTTLTGKKQTAATVANRTASMMTNNAKKALKIIDQYGTIYNSYKETAIALNMSVGSVRAVVRGVRRACKGYFLKHFDNNTSDLPVSFFVKRCRRHVIDNNGTLYVNQAEAARSLGYDSSTIGDLIKNKQTSRKGHSFRYVDQEEVK
jgi:hypothetical protein